MLTIFTSCKPFKGQDDSAQRNAIGSWRSLRPEPEVLVLGDDEGVSETARTLGVIHVPNIEVSEFGKPLVNSVFEQAQKHAKHEFICYVNSDIILMSDFMRAFQKARSKYRDFLLIGKRYDLDVDGALAFDVEWEREFRVTAESKAQLYPLKGIDYFIIKKGGWVLPPFVLGSIRWDNWMIFEGLKRRIPVIDATDSVLAVHQNHEVTRSLGQGIDRFNSDPIALHNLSIYGDGIPAFDNSDATHIVTSARVRRSYSINRLDRQIENEAWLSPGDGKLRKVYLQALRKVARTYGRFK